MAGLVVGWLDGGVDGWTDKQVDASISTVVWMGKWSYGHADSTFLSCNNHGDQVEYLISILSGVDGMIVSDDSSGLHQFLGFYSSKRWLVICCGDDDAAIPAKGLNSCHSNRRRKTSMSNCPTETYITHYSIDCGLSFTEDWTRYGTFILNAIL